MAQPRKKRIIVYEIRVGIFTDFMQKFIENCFDAFFKAMKCGDEMKGRITEYEIKKRIIDGKTFAIIKE